MRDADLSGVQFDVMVKVWVPNGTPLIMSLVTPAHTVFVYPYDEVIVYPSGPLIFATPGILDEHGGDPANHFSVMVLPLTVALALGVHAQGAGQCRVFQPVCPPAPIIVTR